MKKVLIGAIAGAAVTYIVYKMAKEGKLDKLCEDVEEFAEKTKEKADYYADRTQRKAKVAKRNLGRKVDDLKEKVDDLKEVITEKLQNNENLAETK